MDDEHLAALSTAGVAAVERMAADCVALDTAWFDGTLESYLTTLREREINEYRSRSGGGNTGSA